MRQLFCVNGGTVSGNVDVGIYDEGDSGDPETRIVSVGGATAQAGTNQPQIFSIADTVIGPGRFYMALALDNVTGTIFRNVSGAAAGAVARIRATGLLSQDTAFALPASATPAVAEYDYVPVFGLIYGSVAI